MRYDLRDFNRAKEEALVPGITLWNYEFIFSSDFEKIESGTVTMTGFNKRSVMEFNKDLNYEIYSKNHFIKLLTNSYKMKNFCFICNRLQNL